MTKWFDTNYHYIVPELSADQHFSLVDAKPLEAFREAAAMGIVTRPVILGPYSFLKLAKGRHGADPLALLAPLMRVYESLFAALKSAGAEWIQLDEPALVLDLDAAERQAFAQAYAALAADRPKLLLTTYFAALQAETMAMVAGLPFEGLHVDLVRGRHQAQQVAVLWPRDRTLSLGVVDGRNIWRTDLDAALTLLETLAQGRDPALLQVAPSCSLLHSPIDLAVETGLDSELTGWMAFATQKLDEVVALAKGLGEGRAAIRQTLRASDIARDMRRASRRVHNPAVRQRVAAVDTKWLGRHSAFPTRIAAQQAKLALPLFPTTTIGSFPQTEDVRTARAKARKGLMSQADYTQFLHDKVEDCIRRQEVLGLDVLVHGEFERNDMVEYFGEQLEGFAFTSNGWVQSYGTRCVKPPVLFGDVARAAPMTVAWSVFAQSKTQRPMKGMLTGPVTILQWSFVRDDQPRADTCRQIALAIRDEVADLEAAGIGVIQIDEPALREGLPLKHAERQAYLTWAVDAFRLSAAVVRDETQIHTHMCYSEFADIMPAVARLDADVISIETSRSDMDLLGSFVDFHYPNDIGPGVWDIHSPRVPNADDMQRLLGKVRAVLPEQRIWVNPDCGLKTRRWPEVMASLGNLVEAARRLRTGKAQSA
jgi:5-methyltetrahydropteroyltriglutamate--homocysteine methyltransferase